MKKQHEIEELEKQISDLWSVANKTMRNGDFQKMLDRIGEKRKKIEELKQER